MAAKARNARRAEKMLDDLVERLAGPALDQMRDAHIAMPFGAPRPIQGKSVSLSDPAIASLMAEAEAFEILSAMGHLPSGSDVAAQQSVDEHAFGDSGDGLKKRAARRV